MAAAAPRYVSPTGRRTFTLVAFGVLILMAAISSGAEFYEASIGGGGSLTADQRAFLALPVLAYFITFVVTVVAFLLWLHRCYENLAALGERGLRFTPGWAVGWWFIPFANLVRPYQVMRELWRRVAPAGIGLALLQVWWAVWLLANFFDGLVSRTGGNAETAFSNLGDIAAAVLAVLVVVRISGWQEKKAKAG